MNTVSRLVTVVTTAAVVVLAGVSASFADAPSTWEDGPTTDLKYYLTLLVAFPIGLCVVLGLFSLIAHRRNYVPPAPSTDVEPASDHTPAQH